MTENKRYVIEKQKQSCNDPDFIEFIEKFKKEDSMWVSIREITGNKEWDDDTLPLAFTLTFNETAFMRLEDELNELNDEKEFWKSMCCSQSNFNQILLNELDIAQEQGYEVSNPFKKLMEKKED